MPLPWPGGRCAAHVPGEERDDACHTRLARGVGGVNQSTDYAALDAVRRGLCILPADKDSHGVALGVAGTPEVVPGDRGVVVREPCHGRRGGPAVDAEAEPAQVSAHR